MISVIIPIYNQYPSLDVVLWHFSRQNTTKPFEIIIVDDGSLYYDKSVLEKYTNLNLCFLRTERNEGRAKARNLALDNAKGDFLIFCDSDRIPTPDFIESHMCCIDSLEPVVSVGYSTETYENINKLKTNVNNILRRKSVYYKVISQIYNEFGKTDSHLCWLSTLSGNMALKKNTLSNMRFDNDFKDWGFEHFELGYRLWTRGTVFVNNTKAENIHIAHSRNSGFYKRKIIDSHKIFFEKHSGQEILFLKDFMLGELSLQEYEKKICGGLIWMKNIKNPIMINQINF